jgi:hypothetical protein
MMKAHKAGSDSGKWAFWRKLFSIAAWRTRIRAILVARRNTIFSSRILRQKSTPSIPANKVITFKSGQIPQRYVTAHHITHPEYEPAIYSKDQSGRFYIEQWTEYDLDKLIKKSLATERAAIDAYDALIKYLKGDDMTTRRIMEKISEMEAQNPGGATRFPKKSP